MKRLLTMILCVLLTAVSLQWAPDIASAETITEITPGATVKNYMQGGTTRIYTVTPSKVGKLSITITSYVKDDLLTSFYSGLNEKNKMLKNKLYDTSKSRLTVKYTVYVSPRTYYLTIRTPFVTQSGIITIKTKFSAMKTSEGKALNITSNKALTLKNNTFYRGVLAVDEDSDYYSIRLAKTTNFNIKVNCFEKDAINIIIQDSKGKVLDKNWAYYKSTIYSYHAKLRKGKYTIIIQKSGRDNLMGRSYGIALGSYSIDSFNIPSRKTMTVGTTYRLRPEITPKNAKEKYSYRSSNSRVVRVSKEGRMKALKKGTSTITVTSVYGQVSSTCKVTVR